ncbi:MAG: UDP-N-acetylmuramate--L-alanine ligase [bacterium]
MDWNTINKIYIIGIEGGGTSSLASVLNGLGKQVSGVDEGDHFFSQILANQKIDVCHKFDEKNLPIDADLIIYSSAYNIENNRELKTAFEKYPAEKIIPYTMALAGLFNNYSNNIAICGTHGKTSVTAMLSYVLVEAGLKPNAIIGANVPQLKGNSLVNKDSQLFILEADEYQNKLANYNPHIIVLNNIDYDHPDFFKSKEDYLEVFQDFVNKLPADGILIANADDENVMKIIQNCSAKVIKYGQNSNNDISNVETENHQQFFTLDNLGKFVIQLPGKHNLANAMAVILTCLELGLNVEEIRKHLANFQGAERRLQRIGEYNGAVILDDFAHHPTEIRAAIAGAKQLYPDKKLIAVFHPHTFTRTKALFDDFAESFDEVNELIVLDIYGSAREVQGQVSSAELVDKIRTVNKILAKAENIHTLEACETYLRSILKQGDLLVLIGAGDLWEIGRNLIR